MSFPIAVESFPQRFYLRESLTKRFCFTFGRKICKAVPGRIAAMSKNDDVIAMFF